MGTRTNITLQYGDSNIILYRHCDGYPASAGASIIEGLREAPNINALFHALAGERYSGLRPRPVYELTNSIHGDIEHEYKIQATDPMLGGKVEYILHRSYSFKRERDKGDGWTPWGTYTLAQFVEFVNWECREMNAGK